MHNYTETFLALLELCDEYGREGTPGLRPGNTKYATLVDLAIRVRRNPTAARELCYQATSTPNVSTFGDEEVRRALMSNSNTTRN